VREITIDVGEYVDDERRRRRRSGIVAGVAVIAALLVIAKPQPKPAPPPPTPTPQPKTEPTPPKRPVTPTTSPAPPPAPAHLAPLPQALTFAPLTAGTTSPTKLVRIRNDGDEPLPLAGVAGRGDAFHVIHDCPQQLAKNESCSAAIVFAPAAAGAQRGQLTVRAGGGAAAVALSGTARPNPPLDLGVLDFGSATAGTKRPPHALRFANGHAADVVVAKTNLSGGAFAVAADHCAGARVPPGGTCDVTLALTATDAGAFKAKIELLDAQNDIVAFAALAAETTPVRVVEVPPARIDITPRQLDFTQRFRRTKQEVILTNRGGRATTVTVEANGAPFGFVIDLKACNGKTLAPGDACSIWVTALPIAYDRASLMRILVTYDGHTEGAAVQAR
jgi:hypothetical protein